MVQTAPQYVFIHDALLEAIMCGDNSIPAPELRKRFQDLMEVDPESNKSRLQLQFEVSECVKVTGKPNLRVTYRIILCA